jgi:hypothetical protein
MSNLLQVPFDHVCHVQQSVAFDLVLVGFCSHVASKEEELDRHKT